MKKILYFVCITTLLLTYNCSSNSDDSPNDDQPQTCTSPSGVSTTQITDNTATLNWNADGSNTFEIEYGETGFTQGQGQTITTANNSRTLTNLEPGTSYQFYIRKNCGSGNLSIWEGPQSFTTTITSCDLPTNLEAFNITESTAFVSWFSDGTNQVSYDVEYGETGFALGTGMTVSTSNNGIELISLLPTTQYDFYVKANCSGNISSDFVGPATFTTEAACLTPAFLDVFDINTCSFEVFWASEGETAWEIEYGEVGFTIGTGTVINTSDTFYTIEDNIQSNTTYEVYVRANCGSEGFSEYTDALVVTTDAGVESNQLFVGNYLAEQVTPSIFGYDTFDPDGGGVILTLFADMTNGSQVSPNVPLNSNQRSFDADYIAALGFANTQSYVIEFDTSVCLGGNVTIPINGGPISGSTGVVCGGNGIILGPATGGNYTVTNDFQFTLVFEDDVNDECGAGPTFPEILFTKQ